MFHSSVYQQSACHSLGPGEGKTARLMHIIMVRRHTGKAGFYNSQRVPEPVFIPVLWAPYKQEPIFLADKPWYTP